MLKIELCIRKIRMKVVIQFKMSKLYHLSKQISINAENKTNKKNSSFELEFERTIVKRQRQQYKEN